jgi:hypothetical protein
MVASGVISPPVAHTRRAADPSAAQPIDLMNSLSRMPPPEGGTWVGSTSERGQSRHYDSVPVSSGLPLSADILRRRRHVSNVPGTDSCAATNSGHQNSLSVVRLVEQRLGFLQIERVEAFGEPVVDRRQKIAGLLSLAVIAPEPRQAHRRAQLPRLCLLRPRYR